MDRPARALFRRYRLALSFLLALVAIDVVVAQFDDVWAQFDPDDYAARVANCLRRPHDLLIVGGSPVSEGIDPTTLAGLIWYGRPLRDAFNLGLPGGTTTDVWHAVHHGVTTPPRLLVYGISATDLNDNRQEPHGVHSLMGAADLAEWVRSKPGSATWAVKHYARAQLGQAWQLYRRRNSIRLWAAAQFDGWSSNAAAEARRNRTYAADLTRTDGFAPNRDFQVRRLDHLKSAGWQPTPFQFLDRYRIGEHVTYVHRLLDWAPTQGTAVVLVDMPVSEDLETGEHSPAFDQFRAVLAEIERTRGVTVIRASRRDVGLGDEHFADLIHLNGAGSTRLSRWLRVRLEGVSPAVATPTSADSVTPKSAPPCGQCPAGDEGGEAQR